MHLRVLYVSTAGRRIVRVTPQGSFVSFGGQTWKCTRNHLLPGKGKFDVVCVQGQSEAAPIWAESPISPQEADALGNNNLLEQIHALSKGGKSNAVNWISVGLTGLLVLGIIIAGVVIHGDVEDLSVKISRIEERLGTAGGASDTTTVTAAPRATFGGPS